MTQERRRHPRRKTLVHASYSGASGASDARITDVSWGGCFIETRAQPATGEHVTVTITVNDQSTDIGGIVRSVERPFGFSVQFDPLTDEQKEFLKGMLDAQ